MSDAVPCALCGSWEHNRSACPLRDALAEREFVDLINQQDRLDDDGGPFQPREVRRADKEPPCR